MARGGWVEGVRDCGKAACRKFFPPSVLTFSPAGQHILSTSVGLAGQAEPCLLFYSPLSLSPFLTCRGGSLRCAGFRGGARKRGKRDRQTFSVESHFPAVSPLCVFQVLSLQKIFFFFFEEEKKKKKRRGKGFEYKHMWRSSNVTVSIPDAWFTSAS